MGLKSGFVPTSAFHPLRSLVPLDQGRRTRIGPCREMAIWCRLLDWKRWLRQLKYLSSSETVFALAPARPMGWWRPCNFIERTNAHRGSHGSDKNQSPSYRTSGRNGASAIRNQAVRQGPVQAGSLSGAGPYGRKGWKTDVRKLETP